MRRILYRTGLIAQSLFYVAAGVNHFFRTRMYTAIMPPHYHHPAALVQISGVAEILGGIGLLVPQTRRFSAAGIISMLAVYFDVHIFMATHPERFPGLPLWVLYARIPLQWVLIAWATVYLRQDALRKVSGEGSFL